MGTIDIVETPGTGNNSNSTIKPSKIGVCKKEPNHNNTSRNESINRQTLDPETRAWYTKNYDTITVKHNASSPTNGSKTNDVSVVLDSDSVPSIIDDNLVHGTNLDLEKNHLVKESPPHHKISQCYINGRTINCSPLSTY